MGIKVTVRTDNIPRLQASISSKSVDAVQSAANVCRDLASALSPVRTGALRESWYVSGPGDQSDYPQRAAAASSRNPLAVILDEAKAAIVDPSVGQLRNNLGQFSNPEAIVSSAVNYSVFIEEGTRFMGAQPVLHPAAEAARNALIDNLSKVAD